MKKQRSLAFYILIGMILGIIVGILFQGNPNFAVNYIKPFGTIFLNLIKMVVVPVVLFSIIAGVISMKDIKKVGSVGVKTIAFYMVTTCIAVTLGLIFANILRVGGGYKLAGEALTYEAAVAPSFMETFVNIFPSNAVAPLANATMLQVIVIALFFGFGIIVAEKKAEPVVKFVESFNEVCMKVMSMIIKLSPIGVFALLVPVVATNGPQVLLPLLKLILIVYLVYIVHMVVVYSTTVKVMAKISPLTFFKNMIPAMTMAFSSASSVGTLPLNMECTQNMGAKKEISSFVLPLGATINMDGTAIYQGVCAIFIAEVFGLELTIGQQLTVILTATLASIGTAGVPGAGMIMLAMVLQSVGLPIEGIALIAGIDRILDMGRTTVNITGDAACTMCISAMEDKKINKSSNNKTVSN
ncbi:dicarboxylate/amino acid:cation symporter [Clostridium culturomicium]|uniref:dicarboxylate/amino acid:cation symporter n=1 Tax=Clostridium culturomicium TaxID=1499683 RepID=UPI00058F1D34|nr:dicarboxylate/amino acid:cation symporter [Clostridium culturomicium]